jgi:CRISPR-associated protein Csh1
MEENEKIILEPIESPDKLELFFRDMGYSAQQQSLYWLGRIVWRIGKAQSDKGHKQMPVLNKINFNGMDYSKVQRLFVDAFELATQYRIANDIKFSSNMFQQHFPADNNLWQITPQEAVFFILSGFSLYINNN